MKEAKKLSPTCVSPRHDSPSSSASPRCSRSLPVGLLQPIHINSLTLFLHPTSIDHSLPSPHPGFSSLHALRPQAHLRPLASRPTTNQSSTLRVPEREQGMTYSFFRIASQLRLPVALPLLLLVDLVLDMLLGIRASTRDISLSLLQCSEARSRESSRCRPSGGESGGAQEERHGELDAGDK